MRKQIMSIAAAAALLTTGAIAFDTKADKGIYAFPSGTASSIITGAAAATLTAGVSNMTHVGTQGDALIYPLFVQNDDYSSEIVVRNSSNNAIIVKAVLYAGKDSRELLDFNIYLSGKDVCRFTLKGNSIYSEDGSLKIDGTKPVQITGALTDYDKLKFASASEPFAFNFSNSTIPEAEYKHGYIAIMGMVELAPRATDTTTVPGSAARIAFHKDHASIYAAYAQLLDDSRGAWRDIENIAVLKESVFVANVTTSPNVDLTALATPNSVTWNKGSGTQTTALLDVNNGSLSGDVRLTNAAAKTDVLLNATAIQNFSEADKALLWVEREYASISDRCLDAAGLYDDTCVKADAATFNVNTATYNYANKANAGIVDNKIYITQPYKRTLIQLNNGTGLAATGYVGTSVTRGGILTGENAYFTTTASVFDEAEGFPAAPVTSTGTTGLNLSGTANIAPIVIDPTKYDKEVQMIDATAFDKHTDVVDAYGEKDGFAEFSVGTPAIITQMVATKSGDAFVTNWVYSNTK